MFKKLPTRACSRALGAVCDIDLPLWLRKPIIGSYSWYFACNVAEAVEEEIMNYPSLGAFFRRQLKPDARRICDASCIVSTCLFYIMICWDGAILFKNLSLTLHLFSYGHSICTWPRSTINFLKPSVMMLRSKTG